MTMKITVKCLTPENYSERAISNTTFVPIAFPFSSFRSMMHIANEFILFFIHRTQTKETLIYKPEDWDAASN